MLDHLDRALGLAKLGAPLAAQAMAVFAGWQGSKEAREGTAGEFLDISKRAAGEKDKPYRLLPEVQELLNLDQSLPEGLRLHRASAREVSDGLPAPIMATKAGSDDWTVEETTPTLASALPFRDALALADKPMDWGRATPQIKCLNFDCRPSNGALWRGRLTKTTDLGRPLVNGLKSEETIEIRAEGSDEADGSGHRKYSYTLISSKNAPDHLHLIEDTGWIEIQGDDTGTLIQIKKRVTVSPAVDDPFRAILSAGFSGLLWMWAIGFLDAANNTNKQPVEAPVPPLATNEIVTPRGSATEVAVLGAGPAGLACAWLLSNPSHRGQSAWRHPQDPAFRVKVTLVEKECRPGGKAASGRRTEKEAFRIEEHGLHVLMGFYANVFKVMEWVGATDTLTNVNTTLIPGGNGSDLQDAWKLEFQPWKTRIERMTLESWSRGRSAFWNAPHRRAFRFDAATPTARPFLRAFAEISRQMVALGAPPQRPKNNRELHTLATHWLIQRLMIAEMNLAFRQHAAHGDADIQGVGEPGDLAAMARLLRYMARMALPAADPRPAVRRLGELVELATTIVMGLDDLGLFPLWAIDDPSDLLDQRYPAWVRAVQTQDKWSLEKWLLDYGAAAGFPQRSRLLAAVTAGLFTTPAQIAAGTFINGLARFLFTYVGAPYKRMAGGTGEALIGPLFEALNTSAQVTIRAGTVVKSVSFKGKTLVSATVVQESITQAGDFQKWGPAQRPGWCVPLTCKRVPNPQEEQLSAQAFVLAIPPFGAVLPGLPAALAKSLQKIENCATIGLQHWTHGGPKYPQAIISGLSGPLRCAAAMEHLDEGMSYLHAPVYACGDVEDGMAERWRQSDGPRNAWLNKYATLLQQGGQAHEPHVSVNDSRSERYVSANVATQRARRYVYDTGLLNLWLAGDWTHTALSCGSIEAAVTSGLEAARHILEKLGCEVEFPIVGPIFGKEKS